MQNYFTHLSSSVYHVYYVPVFKTLKRTNRRDFKASCIFFRSVDNKQKEALMKTHGVILGLLCLLEDAAEVTVAPTLIYKDPFSRT